MAKLNGNAKWIALAVGIVGSIVGIVLGYGRLEHQVEDNTARGSEITLNTQHRIVDEVDTPYIKNDLEQIKKFTHHQREVNQAIMLKLQIEPPPE